MRRKIWLLMALTAGGLMAWAFKNSPPDRVWVVALDAQGKEVSNVIWPAERSTPYARQAAAPADSGWVVTMEAQRGEPWRVRVVESKPGGEIRWEQIYSIPSHCDAIQRVSGGYVLSGVVHHRNPYLTRTEESQVWMIGIAETGDSLWFLQWKSTVTQEAVIVERPYASGLAVTTVVYDSASSNYRLKLLHVTRAGRLERETILLESVDHFQCVGMIAMAGGGYLLVESNWAENRYKNNLLAVDEQGETYWHRPLEMFDGGYVTMIAALSGGHYLLCGHSRDLETHWVYWAAAKVHPNGDAVWTARFNEGYPSLEANAGPQGYYSYSLLETSDHRYQFAGTCYLKQDQPIRTMTGWLFTLSEQGDSLESRTFLPKNSAGQFNQILPGPEGGVILTGAAYAPREK